MLISALRSLTLNSTPLWVTDLRGSGSRIAAGAQASQMPNQVSLQRPVFSPRRLAQTEPSGCLQSESRRQVGSSVRLSTP